MMERYEIWRARVRFEETDGIKERPVLIWGGEAFLIAYKMTGTDRGDDQEEYRILYWKEAGLSKPTNIRISKVLKLEKTDLLYRIGKLDDRDILKFENRLSSLLAK